MDQNNTYTQMQKNQYDSGADIMAIQNHKNHDHNPDYYGLLLSDIKNDSEYWKNKSGLDFGCGVGRNVDNLLKLANWKNFDGCDISNENLIRANKFLLNNNHKNYNLIHTDGISLNPIKDNFYDFIMSTIVLQHIAVYDIRINILKDLYRILKSDGLFSFQMAKYNGNINRAKYFENSWLAQGTNGYYDVSVDDPNDLINDLVKIGFNNITYEIKPEWDADNLKYTDINSSSWIFVKCKK